MPGRLLLALTLAAGVAAASTDVRVLPHVDGGELSVSFAAPGAFTADVREAVQTGLPITFTFTVELRRSSAIWFDQTLATATVASMVRFDNLTRIYQVTKLSEGRVVWSDRSDQESRARDWATGFDRVAVGGPSLLQPNVDYYVRVRLRAGPHRSFFLWPWGHDDADGRADFTFIR